MFSLARYILNLAKYSLNFNKERKIKQLLPDDNPKFVL